MISPVMSTEERLRAATRAAADTVPPGSAPPLRLPADPDGRRFSRACAHGGRLRRGGPRALTPLAAAAAVIVVLTASLAAGRGTRPPGGPAAARPGHHESLLASCRRTTSPWRATARWAAATRVQVRATATGKVLATVRPPRPYTAFSR